MDFLAHMNRVPIAILSVNVAYITPQDWGNHTSVGFFTGFEIKVDEPYEVILKRWRAALKGHNET